MSTELTTTQQNIATLDEAQIIAFLQGVKAQIAVYSQDKNLSKLKDARDLTKVIRELTKSRNLSKNAQREAAECHVLSIRAIGKFLRGLPKNTGAKGIGPNKEALHSQRASAIVPTHAELGIDKDTASRSQRLAKMPDEAFDAMVADYREKDKELTVSASLLSKAQKAKIDRVESGETTNVHVSDDSYEWYTPAEYIEAVREVMGSIDLDPASTEVANRTVKASRIITKEENGLCQQWQGNVFLNPPYNMPLVQEFIEKAIEDFDAGNVQQAIILINNATDTAYCQMLLSRFAACFTRGRVRFSNPQREQMQTRQGQVFFYLTNSPTRIGKFTDVFGKFGVVVKAL